MPPKDQKRARFDAHLATVRNLSMRDRRAVFHLLREVWGSSGEPRSVAGRVILAPGSAVNGLSVHEFSMWHVMAGLQTSRCGEEEAEMSAGSPP